MRTKTFLFFLTAIWLFGSSSYAKKPSLGVYIWSGCFEKISLQEIERFIEVRGIERIELSYRPFVEREDVRGLAGKLAVRGKEVEIVLSEPTYIFPEKWNEVKGKLVDIFKSGFDVHLDIEPHILPNFKENEGKYLEFFVSFLRKVHLVAREYRKKVSVAISVSHYRSVIKAISKNSDLIVLMVYGIKRPDKIYRIVNAYKRNRLALALRAEDFQSGKELIEFINDVSRITGVGTFIIQNLRQWKRLE